VHFERSQGELVVCRDEHHRGRAVRQQFKDFEA
jgi:hypothetical protein